MRLEAELRRLWVTFFESKNVGYITSCFRRTPKSINQKEESNSKKQQSFEVFVEKGPTPTASNNKDDSE